MDLQAKNTADDVLQNGILIATNAGVVCVSLTDALSSNLNLSVEDLKTVAEQLILEEERNKHVRQEQYSLDSQISSDATVESDDPNPYNNLVAMSNANLIHSNIPLLQVIKSEASFMETPTECDSSASDTVGKHCASSTSTCLTSTIASEMNKLPPKRRGGWPKGRKRKPELLHLPPKAPATGYNLYLNDLRKQFKNSPLAFHEITKIIGNQWSSLSLAEKQPYLERAEEDKRRYKEELRAYRQSGAYQLYLAKKRRKRLQNNVLSESDMDATDDIDDEDNEELYCRTCDQWFHNLHNKREHLQGRQHIQAMVGDMRTELASDYDTDCFNTSSFSTSLDESSLDALPSNPHVSASSSHSHNKEELSVSESIAKLISVVAKREKEVKSLKIRVEEAKAAHGALFQQLSLLKDRETTLKNDLRTLQTAERDLEAKVFQLWQVPSLFVTTDYLNSEGLDGSEYLTDE